MTSQFATPTDTVDIADSTTQVVALLRANADTKDISETVARLVADHKALADTISISETRVVGRSHAVADTIGISETFHVARRIFVTDSVPVSATVFSFLMHRGLARFGIDVYGNDQTSITEVFSFGYDEMTLLATVDSASTPHNGAYHGGILLQQPGVRTADGRQLVLGTSAFLNGINSYVDITAAMDLIETQTKASIYSYFKPTNTTQATLLSVADQYDNPFFEVVWSQGANSKMGVNVLYGGSVVHYDASQVIGDLNWHSFALVLDDINQAGALYVDGRLGVGFPIDPTTWPTGTIKAYVGARTNKTSWFCGSLDNSAMTATAMDDSEVFQVTTRGLYGTTLYRKHAGTTPQLAMAAVGAVATLIPIKVGPPVLLEAWTADEANRASVTYATTGSMTVVIPVAPPSLPNYWTATVTSDVLLSDTTLSVEPLTVAIPVGATLYFPDEIIAILQAPANVRDTSLSVKLRLGNS